MEFKENRRKPKENQWQTKESHRKPWENQRKLKKVKGNLTEFKEN